MTTRENQAASNADGKTDAGTEEQFRESRRRLIKGGLAAGPVLMTLASRPVLAGGGGTYGGGACATASGFQSANASQQGKATTCSGCSPTYWQNNYGWPTPYYSKNSYSGGWEGGKFSSTSSSTDTYSTTTQQAVGGVATYFHSTTTGLGGTQFGSKTMLEVLNLSGGGYIALGRYIAAALLNAKAGLVPATILPESTVRNMWNSYVLRGYYEPTAGVKWYPDDMVVYLKSTMPG